MAIVTLGIDRSRQERFCREWCGWRRPCGAGAPQRGRGKLLELVASVPPCLVGMEACSGAHHWARLFAAHGHTVRPMASKFVVPYRLSGKRGKNDAADAAAICEAVRRPNMRLVPPMSVEQQSQLLVHRAHQGFVQQRICYATLRDKERFDEKQSLTRKMNRRAFVMSA